MEESEDRPNRLRGITDSPRGGPTLSTSTSSFEALDPHDSNLSKLATKAFDKTSMYVTHEMHSSIEDYKLLENMNRATISKYSDMQQISENLATSSIQLKEKFDILVRKDKVILTRRKISFRFVYRCRTSSKSTTSRKQLTNWKNAPINWMHTAKNLNRNLMICLRKSSFKLLN